MRRSTYLFLSLLALAVGGCGGTSINSGFGPSGDVAGVVFDTDGNIVRDADVYIQDPANDTVSNSSGTYILHDVPADDVIVHAKVTKNGVTYVGQNLARVFSNDRARNVNIVVVQQNQTAQIHGTVFDQNGNVVSGARVFAIGANNLTSNMAVTTDRGNYTISNLAAGIDYELNASSPDFRSDGTVVTLNANDNPREDFTLDQASGVSILAAPNNVSAIAWTSPDDSTRSVDAASAYEAVKRLYDPKRATRAATSRLTPSGDIVEVDLTWDRVSSDFLLGYGIYNAVGANGTLQSDDFLRDPLAEFYADTNDTLSENTTYSYALTSVNTDRAESDFSNRAVVQTLGPTSPAQVLTNPLEFQWDSTFGAQNYVVFVFNQAPRIGVSSIWNNANSPTSQTSLTYGGPALNPGQTYYVIVLALANNNTSRSISPVVSFTAP